jgi:hypothetical protein
LRDAEIKKSAPAEFKPKSGAFDRSATDRLRRIVLKTRIFAPIAIVEATEAHRKNFEWGPGLQRQLPAGGLPSLAKRSFNVKASKHNSEALFLARGQVPGFSTQSVEGGHQWALRGMPQKGGFLPSQRAPGNGRSR